MARIRSIKPELPADRTLSALDFPVRYTFILLISQADDYGLLMAEPRQLLGLLYPHDERVSPDLLESWLDELVRAGRIGWRWTTDGARVLEIVNWAKHQQVKSPGKPLLRDRLQPPTEGPPPGCPRIAPDLPPKRRRVAPGLGGAERERERDQGTGKGIISAGGWPAEARDIFAEHIGLREVREFGRQLKPAVDAHGWDAVKPWWEAYCRSAPYRKRDGSIHGDRAGDRPEDAVKNVAFCSPADFVKTLTVWRQRCEPLKLA